MNYYRYEGHTLCAWDALPYERIGALPGEGEIIFLFAREMLTGRVAWSPYSPMSCSAITSCSACRRTSRSH